MLNPVFSAGNLRNMAPVVYNVAHKVRQFPSRERRPNSRQTVKASGRGRYASWHVSQGGQYYGLDGADLARAHRPSWTRVLVRPSGTTRVKHIQRRPQVCYVCRAILITSLPILTQLPLLGPCGLPCKSGT